jgi:hypothetical protein
LSTNRVLLSAGGLKISKPGFNVLGSISDSQVSFDSSWPKAQRILTRGTVNIGTGSLTKHSVYYPRSLSSVPTALILLTNSTISYWQSVGNVDGVYANANMNGQIPYMTATAYSDRIDFLDGFLAYTASYIVLIP